MIKILLTITLILSTSLMAEARPLPIKIIVVKGNNWIGEDAAYTLNRNLRTFLRRKVYSRIRTSLSIVENFTGGVDVDDVTYLNALLYNYARLNSYNVKYPLVHYVLPPYEYQPGWFQIAGLAFGQGCSLNEPLHNYSFSNAMLFSSKDNRTMFRISVIAAAHEITHNLGAKHVGSKTLMNYQVLGFANEVINLDPKNKKEINFCLKEKKYA